MPPLSPAGPGHDLAGAAAVPGADRATDADRVAGCLLGGAVGDALGAGVEFLRLDAIRARFGPRGVTGYVPAYGRLGAITDDTQMTLFTAEGLVRAWRGRERGACDVQDTVWRAYLRWLVTQGERPRGAGGFDRPAGETRSSAGGSLVADRRLHALRAPGNTCLSALRSGRMGTADDRINDSKGCGGVMRVAPAGLVGWPLPAAFALGRDLAAITHGHPSGFLAAGVLAAMVGALAAGADVAGALAAGTAPLADTAEAGEVAAALDAAVALAARGTPAPEELEGLGGGWVAEEALAIAVCCALVGERTGSLREALLLAVNHGGDSDSTGAITGNLLGARWGRGALPEDLLRDLELRDVVERAAADLGTVVSGTEADLDSLRQRYAGA